MINLITENYWLLFVLVFLLVFAIIFRKSIEYGLYLSAFLLPLEDLTILFTDFTLIRFIIIIIFMVWLLQIALKSRQPNVPKLLTPLLLLIVLSGLSYFWSQNTRANLSSLFSFTQLILWLIMTIDILDDENKIKTAAKFYIIGSLVVSGIAFVLFYTGGLEEANRIASIEGQNPNGFSRSVGVAFIMLVFSMYSGYFFRNKLFNIMGIVVTGLVIILAVSRGTYVAVIIPLIIFLLGSDLKHKFSIAIALILLFVFLFTFFEPFVTDVIMPRIIGIEGLGGRRTIWTVSLSMIRENFLSGVGFGNFPVVYGFYSMNLRGWTATSGSHNVYIRIFAELGIAGIFLFLLFHLILFKAIFQYPKSSKIKTFLFAFFSYLVVGGMSTDLLLSKYYIFGFALIISFLQIKENFTEKSHDQDLSYHYSNLHKTAYDTSAR